MKMKKIFFKLTMLLFLLGMSVNAAWAVHLNPKQGGYDEEQAQSLGFWAKLTAKPAATTNGSGKVFVIADYNYSVDPTDGDYASLSSDEDWSDIYLASSIINADVEFKTYAKADDGSYFTGWSFTDGYTDLGTDKSGFPVMVTPSSTKAKANVREYNLYAAFEPIQLVSYTQSGSQEVSDDGAGNWKCTQTIKFRAETPGVWALSSADDVRHFKLPVIAKKAGTAGTWAIDDAAWIASGAGQNISFYGDYAELTIPITFTAPNDDVADYAATLTLETYAGVKMTAYLNARRTVAGAEAIRYNKSKVQQEAGDLATLLTNAAADDIIKLNGNYSDAVSINKSITFDLNGYTLSNTLTVSGGNVTIAYSAFGGTANALNVTGGKAILNGGTFGTLTIGASGTVEQNGATFTGAATNNGSLTTTDGKFQGGLTSSKTLVVNGGIFNGDIAINVTGGTAQIKRGTISGSTYGVQSAATTTIEKLAAITGGTKALYGNGGTLTVNNGKFTDPANLIAGAVTFKAGYFRTNNAGGATALGKQVWRNTSGVENREGYEFFVGDQEAAQASNVSVCRIGQTAYASLEDALAYVNNSGKEVFIIMENDYVLPAGYYTIPSNATLIVPMSNDQETDNPIVPRSTDDIPAPVSFRKLIFESGVNMEVAGTLEVTCTQYGQDETMGIPGGNYGHLILRQGSRMTINNGGELRAWGFVTGDGTKDSDGNYLSGEIDARRGSIVREMFQMGDWKGGDISLTMVMPISPFSVMQAKTHLFPIYTYFIQNVESPAKYHPGASLICATSVNVDVTNAYANDIKVVGKEGEAAMFLMDEKADAENTWVRKYYDAKKDQQVYEVNSGAKLGSIVIDLGEVPGAMFGGSGTFNIQLDSRKFVLPLTNNFKIHLLSGYMQFTQSTSCLPGMEVEVDKESEISITKSTDASIVSGALYLYDADQWSYNGAKGYVGNSGKFGAIVRYSATWDLGTNGVTKRPNVRDISSPSKIGDAILNVHGTFRMGTNCAVYTTWKKDNTLVALDESDDATGGASIISTNEDAGTFIFEAPAPSFDGIVLGGSGNFVSVGQNCLVNYDHNDYSNEAYPIHQTTVLKKDARMYGWELCTSAKLKNADGSFVPTDGTLANKSYCFIDGKWSSLTVAGCFMVDAQDVYYAKPSEYVALANGTTENADHTYSDRDGAGRLFILMDDCQWWEVEKKDNLYHCIHPDNDTYYYWDEDDEEWKEQRFTITWLNWDGDTIKSYTYNPTTGEPREVLYSVTYGTQAEYLGSTPTREPNIDYTYDFTGWSPALGKVTSDVTYTATYSEQPRKYTIIFTTEGGTEIERHFLTHNELPVCENVPTKTGFTLQWEPALAAVTGDTTYRATWLEVPPTEYEIRFVDYDGTELQSDSVEVGKLPTAPTITAGIPAGSTGKKPTKEFTYVFDHWSPAVEEVTQAMTYTAVYREVQREYTVTFQDENGDEIETNTYHYGETPACSATPVKESDNANDYTFAWYPQIQTVMADAEYKATFTPVPKKYALTLKCSPSGAATFTGARADYIYDADAEVTVTPSDPKYEFEGWSDLESTDPNRKAISRIVTITGDITLVAEFSCSTCDNVTITWRNYDGSLLKEVSQAKGTATTYTGPTPEREATSAETFTFDGWSIVQGGERVYKNGMTPKAAEGGATYYAHFAPEDIPSLEVSNGVTQLSAPVTYQNLILTSDGVHSGQLLGQNYLTLTGNAYFDFKVNTQPRKWYAIAVPWLVDAATGISANGHTLTLNSGVYVLTYDGARRAAQGPQKTWTQLSNGDVMQPGILYMVCVMENASSIRFAKKAGADLLTTTTSVSEYPEATDNNGKDASWNGVANPALFHAYVNAGVTYGQVYIPELDSYDPIVLNTTKLVVGQGAYVQVPADKNITVTQGGEFGPSPAPRRMVAENETSNYEVRFAPINQNFEDRVFVQTDDSKTPDVYTVGLDLAKMGVSAKIAQIWIDRYDTKLCLNTMAPVNGTADYPLVLSVPQDGKYTIDILRSTEEQPNELYLTRDGEAIWNLSQNAYTMRLEQGTTARYGLRTIAKAPQVTTDFEPIWVDPEGNAIKAAKVLINDHVYIIRDGKLYTITGSLVR